MNAGTARSSGRVWKPIGLAVILAVAVVAPGFAANTTERVNVASDGTQADGTTANSARISITPDGRFVAFESFAANLVPGDTNDAGDAFLFDRDSNTMERVSVSGSGTEGNGLATLPRPSGDGSLVVFASRATNLVPGDTNGVQDVFLRDRGAGTTTRIVMGMGGAEPDGPSWPGGMTPDGRHVLFSSAATNLVPGDTNGADDVFVLDRQSGNIERVSVTSAGVQGDGESWGEDITPDGRFVVLETESGNFLPGDTNGDWDTFRFDRQTDTLLFVGATNTGQQPESGTYAGSITSDGRYVAFWSEASDLVSGDTNGFADTFVRDLVAGTTERVSVTAAGVQGSADSYTGVLSRDGRVVIFESEAPNLVPGDANGKNDVFVHDRTTKQIERLSLSTTGGDTDDASDAAVVSADGRYVAFRSWATDLVPGDTNGLFDVFVVDRGPQAPPPPLFSDIATSPYKTAIEDLVGAGIINGYEVNAHVEFRPDNHLWRAQFAKMIVGSWGFPVAEGQSFAPFTDLGADDAASLYPHEYVGVAYLKGITKGTTGTTFGPYVDITRAQLITMVVRSVKEESPGSLVTPPSGWVGALPASDPTHGPNIRLAEHNGVLGGIALVGWDIWAPATRGETAQILFNMRGK